MNTSTAELMLYWSSNFMDQVVFVNVMERVLNKQVEQASIRGCSGKKTNLKEEI